MYYAIKLQTSKVIYYKTVSSTFILKMGNDVTLNRTPLRHWLYFFMGIDLFEL